MIKMNLTESIIPLITKLFFVFYLFSCSKSPSIVKTEPYNHQDSLYRLYREYKDVKLGLTIKYYTSVRCGGCWEFKKFEILRNDSSRSIINYDDDYTILKNRESQEDIINTSFQYQFNQTIANLKLAPEEIPPLIYIIFNKLLNYEYVQPSHRVLAINNLKEAKGINSLEQERVHMNILYDSLEKRGWTQNPEWMVEARQYELYNIFEFKTYIKVAYKNDTIVTSGIFPRNYQKMLY